MTNDLRKLCERAARIFGSPQNHTSAQIDAMVDELESAGRGDAWLPIETAPEHCEVLIYRDDCGVLIGQKTCLAELLTTSEAEEGDLDEETLFAMDWFGADTFTSDRLEGGEIPTHWQPLPPPPKEPTND